MGDPALADPDKSPTIIGWTIRTGREGPVPHVKGNWQLVVDNLLDLTHLAFMHETTIGNSALVDQARSRCSARRTTSPSRAGSSMRRRRPPSSRRVNSPPTSIAGRSSISPRRHSCVSTSAPRRPAPARRRASASAASACGISTPSPRKPRPPATTSRARRTISTSTIPRPPDIITDQIRMAFLEDVAVFEAQQRNLQLIPNPPQTDINANSGVIQARRILIGSTRRSRPRGPKMVAAERRRTRSASPSHQCVTRAGPVNQRRNAFQRLCGFLAGRRVPRHDGLCRGPQRADAAPLIRLAVHRLDPCLVRASSARTTPDP